MLPHAYDLCTTDPADDRRATIDGGMVKVVAAEATLAVRSIERRACSTETITITIHH